MAACDQNLTSSERKRNQHGPMLQYDYHPEPQELVEGMYSFKSLHHIFCTEKLIWYKDILVSSPNTVSAELTTVGRTEYFQGFPSMKHLKYKFEVKNSRVKVFDYPSRNENIILKPENQKDMDDIYEVAKKYLNQSVFIGWPHLIKAKVVGISNKEKYICTDGIKELEPKVFDFEVKNIQEHLSTRMGIEFADYSVLVHVRTCMGTSYVCGSQGKISINEIWNSSTTAYPAQGVVSDIVIYNSNTSPHKKVEQLFPENSKIFFVGNPYYGSEGVVMNPMLVYECGRLQVNITVLPEPDFTEAKRVQSILEKDYINSFQAAAQLGIHVKSLIRIIGSVLIVKGVRRPRSDLPENIAKLNIGLQFKYIKQQEELAGYARYVNNQWCLSSKAITLVQSYLEKFPDVIEYLSKTSDRADLIFEEDIFPSQVEEKRIDDIVNWLKEQDHIKAERVAWGSKTLEKECLEKVLDAIEHLKTLPVKTVKLQVKPHLLLKPDVSLPDIYKSKSLIKLFDRVVIVKTTYMIPLGCKGTVVGIHPVSDPNPVRLECVKVVDNFYEVLFDKHLTNGHDIHGIAAHRVCKVPESSILLIYTADNIKTRNFDDSKIYSPLENTNELAKSTCKFSAGNEYPIAICEKNPPVGQAQVIQKGSDDFWKPVVNTKLTQKTNQIQSTISGQNTQQFITAQATELQQCSDGTQLLKSLLGLPANQNQVMTATTTKPQLPQPPPSWRSDAQKIHNIPHNFVGMSLNKNAEYMTPNASIGRYIFPLHANQRITRQYQQEYQADPRARIVKLTQEQNSNMIEKRFSSNSLNKKGAFIPLQVSRKSFSNSPQAPTMSSNIPNDSMVHNDITQNVNQLSLRGDNGSYINDHIDVKPSHGIKKPPRIPKIGAKFDNLE